MSAIAVTQFAVDGSPVPAGTSEDDFVGSTATLNLQFSNGSATDTGFAPYIALTLPAGADALSFKNATYLGQPLTAQTVTFDSSGKAENPFADDQNGDPLVVTGPPGGTLVVLQLPFGSFTPGQTPAGIAVNLGVSSSALIGSPLGVTVTGGFALGDDATGLSSSNPPIVGTSTSYDIVPQIVSVQTTYQGPEQETATGPSYPHDWNAIATIAPGQTLTNLVITQKLPDGAVFLPGASELLYGSGQAAGTITYNAATNTVTGTFTQSVTGGTAGNPPTLQAAFYVTQNYSKPADGTTVLNPASGAFAPLTDSASLSANWASGNLSNPTALSAGPVDNTITAKSIAIQKSVQDLSNTVDIQPGDTLQYTLNGQVSNYFDLNTLVQTDVLGDGQTFLSSFTPTITIDELGHTVYSGVVATSEYTVSAKAADGTSTVTFNISKILTDHGQPGDLNGGTAANPQPATTTLVFETTIDKTYSENPAPPVSTLVNQGDTISDTVTYSGDVAGTGDQVSDGSSASVALPTNTVKKSIYAVNGVRVTGPVTLQAGDTVTYDLQLTTPLTSTQDVTLTDFLPEPVLSAADPKANGSNTGFTFVDTKSVAAPAAGVAKFGPADTFMATIPGDVPTISTNATANSLSFNLGNYTFNPAYPTNVADILYTVTVGDQPFADGLLLTNQVTSSETNSFGTVSQANSIVQLTLGEPVLSVQKGSIATSDPKAVFSGSEGPAGAITDTSLAANPLNDSLSGIVGGDTVTFRVIVQNTGSGPNGAFDVVLNDTLPSGFINPTNITVTNGAGQALAYTNVGGGLFDPAGGIQLTDNGSNGALSSDSATSGGNIAVITYTATAAPGVPVPGYDLQNTATVTHYAAEAGGVNDTSTSTPTALSASTNVYTATPDFAKGVISTSQHSPTSGSNNLADLAIGEQFTYDLTVTLTKGTANDVTVTDPLPAGVTLLGYSVHVGSDITGAYVQSSPASPSFPYDGTISFNLGNLTDNSNAQGVNDQVVIGLTAEVVDTTGNAGGTQLINTGTLTETNPNDPAGTPYTQSASATETVVEPNLSLTKTASTATAQAGDVVTYTLHYVNAAGAASAAAYSSVISDALDQLGADATFNAGSVKILSGTTASGVSITQGNAAGDTAVAVDVAEIDPGQAVDLSYSVTLTPSAVSGDVLPNVATYSAGTLANGDPAERTESGAGTADVTVQQASISKAMIAGSDPNIPVGKLAVGETGTYQIVVAVPHGVAPDAFITDSLPAGLDDLQIQSVVLGSNVTTTQQSVISNASAFSINLGTVTDSGAGATTAADDITVTYTAIADTAPSNLPGAVDTNTAQFASVNYSVTATANTDIVAPDVTISKTDNVTSVVAGQDITYTVTLHNIGSSPAYDESVTDALPLDATFVAGSLTATNGATASITGGTISVTDAALAANGTVTVTYQATANADVTPGETLSNTATERYASQPTGGQTYTGSSTAAVPVVLPPSDVKTIAALSNSFSTSNVITGETITYQIVGTLSPGQQAVELTDALPLGLSLVSETVTSVGSGLTGISTGAVTPNGAGTVVFSDVTAAAGGADSFTVDVVAKVGLVSGGTQFSNTATIGVSAPGTSTPVSSASSTAPVLTDAKSSLSGTVFIDHNDDGVENGTDAGKGGVVAELLNSTGSLVATTTTASNGTYSFAGLEAGTYSVKFVAPSGYVFDTVQGSGNAAADSIVSTAGKTAPVTLAPGASTPNQNAGLYQPVSFSGTVFQDQNADGSQQSGDTGVSGDTVTLYQTGSTTPVATTTTGTNGAYSFTGLAPGSYDAVISPVGTESFSPKGTSGASPNSVVSATGTTPTTTLQSGQSATAQDAGVYGPGSLSGTVFTDNNDDGVLDGTDAGQSGVTVELEQAGTVVATTTTGANGAYSFGGLTPGAYSVQVVAPTGEDFSSTPGANPNAALDSIVNTSGATVPVAVTSLTDTPNQNAGLYAPVTVSGDVFTDQNANGVQDTGDAAKSGITVDLTTAGGTAVASTTTDANGDYSFTGLLPGDYTVTVVPPSGYDISPAASGNPAKDSVVDPTTGQVTTGPLLSGQSSTNDNAGLYQPASLSGLAFFDNNGDGIENGADAPIAGVTVKLLDSSGNPTGATTTTAADGSYSFTGLVPGTYSVAFVTPTGDTPDAVVGASGNPALNGIAVGGTTPAVSLTSGESLPNQNAGFDQLTSLSGTVFNDSNADGVQEPGETGVASDTVTLLDKNGNAVATTTTSATGTYSFGSLNPGTYSVQVALPAGDTAFSPTGASATLPDSIVNSSGTTTPVELDSGKPVTGQDAGVYGPGSLSGTVFTDNNDDGVLDGADAGQSGVMVELEQAGTVVATTTTGANGAYSFGGLTPGAYSVQVVAPTGEDFSSTPGANPNAALDSIVNTSGATPAVAVTSLTNTPNQNAGLYAPVTVSGDVFTDQNANGVQETGDAAKSGITVDLTTSTGTAVASTTTDANGDYSFTGLLPGTYTVTVVPPAGYDISPAANGNPAKDSVVDPTTGQVTTGPLLSGQSSTNDNAGLYQPASLSGIAFFDNNGDGIENGADAPIAGVTVKLLDSSGNPTGANTTTAADGSYSFAGLVPGTYSVAFVTPTGDTPDPVTGTGSNPALNSIAVSGTTPPVTLTSGESLRNQNAGFDQPVSLSGTVFNDSNADGVQGPGETGAAGDTVTLLDRNGNPVATTTTAADGSYSFGNLNPGTYSVQVGLPAGDTAFSPNGASATLPDSIVNSSGDTAPVTLSAGHAATGQDAGAYGPGSLSGTVFTDNNDDGVVNGTDAGAGGVTVKLIDSMGNTAGTTVTAADGTYSFTGLAPANYSVQVVPPAGDKFSDTVGTKGNPALDSIVNTAGATRPVAVKSNANTPNQNAGLYVPVSVSGDVFTDQNGNGVQEGSDAAQGGVVVNLTDAAAGTFSTTTTAADGTYEFTGLEPGDYTVTVVPPSGYRISPVATGNPAVDSVVNPGTGQVTTGQLNSGQSATNENAGLYQPVTVSGIAFFDNNGDGVKNGADAGLGGVTVNLLDALGNPTGATTVTAADGSYSFAGLLPGTYSVQFVAPSGDFQDPVAGTNPDASLDSITAGGITPAFTLASGQSATTENGGLTQIGSLSGEVFTDSNDNGVIDGGDAGLSGVTVELLSGSSVVGTTVTDANGNYRFNALQKGDYSVQVVAPAGDHFSDKTGGDPNAALDSVVDTSGASMPVSVKAGQNTPDQNAGVYVPVSVSGDVFLDANGNGVQDPGEAALPGVTVTLVSNGTAVGTALTDANGAYDFTGLPPGTYNVVVTAPAGDKFSPAASGNPAKDSVVNSAGASAPVTLGSGQADANQNAGVFAPVTIGGTAFLDAHEDGLDDYGNPAFAGVVVKLYSGNGTYVGSTVTDAKGQYSFTGLLPGAYQVKFTAPDGTQFTAERAGSNNLVNSDANPATGASEVFNVTSGQTDLTHGVGFILPATSSSNMIYGGGGNTVIVGSGSVSIEGGSGNDLILGGNGSAANIQGVGVNDILYGNTGTDTIQVHGGNEFVATGPGNAVVFGAGGTDTFVANTNGGTIDYAGGVFSNISYGQQFISSAPTSLTYNKGDGVVFFASYNAAAGDTLHINGYTAPTAVGSYQGYDILYFGHNAAVILQSFTAISSAGLGAGITYSATIPTNPLYTISVSSTGAITLIQTGNPTPLIGTTPSLNPTITGAQAGQSASGTAAVTPFANVVIADPANPAVETVTVTPFSQADGTFGAALSGGSVTNGIYSVTGTAAQVTAAIEALTYVPNLAGTLPGHSLTQSFTIAVTDGAALTATDSTTSVIFSNPDIPPTITGIVAGQTTPDTAAIAPFSSAVVTDPDGGLQESLTVTLSSTANGALSGTGGAYNPVSGVFSFTGTASAVTAVLNSLLFTPSAHEAAAGTTVTTGFSVTVTDSAGGTVTDSTATVGAVQSAAPAVVAPVPVSGSPWGGSSLNLGGGNHDVALHGYANSVTVGDGDNAIHGGAGGTTVLAGNGTNTIDVAGYGNSVTVGSGTDSITAGSGATINTGGGDQTITLAGYGNMVFIGGNGLATLSGGQGNDHITTAGGAATITLGGFNDVVTTGAADDTITDGGGGTTFIVGGTNAGMEVLQNFAAKAGSVVDVAPASAGGLTAAQILGSLTSTASGAELTLAGGGTVLFAGLTIADLHPANFKVG